MLLVGSFNIVLPKRSDEGEESIHKQACSPYRHHEIKDNISFIILSYPS